MERNKRVQEVFLREYMGRFRDLVISRLPNEEWVRAYKDSIVEREIATSLRPGQVAYALIADPKAVRLDDEPEEQTAVYVTQTQELVSPLATLLITHSPWTIDRLPREAKDVKGVQYVHRRVSEDEVVRLRDRNDDTLETFRGSFRDAGATYTKDHEEKVEKPASLPDVLFQAIRMEFGIKERMLQHWGFAYRLREQTLKGMISSKLRWEKYLGDPTYTKWVAPLPDLKKIPGQQVKIMLKEFQSKIAQ